MSKINRKRDKDGMRAEYDFSGGVRGKYAKRYAQGTNIVRLDPDVSKIFRTSESVNLVLRSFVKVLKHKTA